MEAMPMGAKLELHKIVSMNVGGRVQQGSSWLVEDSEDSDLLAMLRGKVERCYPVLRGAIGSRVEWHRIARGKVSGSNAIDLGKE